MSSLITIRPRTEQCKPLGVLDKLQRGPIVDKFFLLGALVSFIGLGYLGSHLWLMRRGLMEPSTSFNHLKLIHSELQLFVFFGLFIVGFCIQAGPRLLNVSGASLHLSIFLAFTAPIAAVMLRIVIPENLISPPLYATPFLIALVTLVQLSRRASRIPPFLPFLAFGLIACILSCFLPIHRPEVALLVLWAGVGSAIFGVWQVFIANLMGGRRLGVVATILFAFGHLLTLAALTMMYLSEDRLWGVYAGVFGLCTITLYFFGTQGWRIPIGSRHPALQIATISAFIWTLSTWALLAASIIVVDEAFHVLATGFGTSLVLALSLHIVGHLGGGEALSTFWTASAISVWQLVPLMRGYSRILDMPQSVASMVAIIASVVIVIWLVGLLRCEFRILRRQSQLQGNEEMVKD